MHVGLRIEGDVVVHHQGDAIHIEAAGGHIGGDEHIHRAVLEPLDRAFPLVLGHIAVEYGHVVTLGLQGLRHGDGDRLGAGKDDHPFLGFRFQHAAEGLEFLRAVHRDEALADPTGVGPLGADCDLRGVVEIFVRNPPDLGRHGGGEEHHLALAGQLFQHPFHVVDEAHAQHFIGFIEHEAAQARQVEGALAHVIHHAAGGPHHDLHTALEAHDLIAEIGAAVDGQHAQMRHVGRIALEGIGHLDGQFAGGREHQHLRAALLGVEIRQHRQGEGRGLAGAGLGLAHQIAAEEQLGDRCFLDRRGLLIADRREGIEHLRGEAEARKALRFGRNHGGADLAGAAFGGGEIDGAEIHRRGFGGADALSCMGALIR